MSHKKTVAVLGATGQQGRSVVEELLKWPELFTVRGLTRNTDSAKSKSLIELGVEMRAADIANAASLESAFEEAHIIYAMTDFWQTMSFDIEYAQGKSIADIASKLPLLEHFIWSSLPDAKSISNGRYANVLHWQSKAAVTDYIRQSLTDLWAKTTVILFPNYFENCLTNSAYYLPVKQKDGSYLRSFPLPSAAALPNAAISDTGRLVSHVIEHGTDFFKQTVAFYAQSISEKDKFDVFAKANGIEVKYHQTPEDEFRKSLEATMGAVTALDFTEQLTIFDGCGNIYARPEFIQANQIPGLKLTTWEEFIAKEDLMAQITEA